MRSRPRISVALASFAPLAAFVFVLGSWLRPATAQLLGPEFQVNSYTTGDQNQPVVAAGSAGNFVMAWSSVSQDGSGDGVFGQRFDSTGNPVGSEFQVNTYTTSNQTNPAVAAGAAGNFVVVWDSYGQDGASRGVFGQGLDSGGNPVGSEFQVNSYTTSFQDRAAVAADGLGNFVVAWMSYTQDGSNWGVFAQRVDSVGSPVGSEFQVNSYTTFYQWSPAVAADALGNFVVVWASGNQDGSLSGVFGQRFDSAGSPVGSEFQVNTYTTNYQRVPAVAGDGAGNFVVAWQSFGQDGSGEGIFGQRFDSAGSPVGTEFEVNSYTTNAQGYPAVAADGAGNFVVVWESNGQDGSSFGMFGQQFDSAGSPVGSEFQINAYTTDAQASSAVAVDGTGNFVVAWNGDSQDGSGRGVFGQRLRNSIFLDDFETGTVCAWSAAVGSGDTCPP